MAEDFDDIILGSGMAGLSVAGLLARSGRRVLVLEAHDVLGGYAHTFTVGRYRFCAQVHYIFGCGEGESFRTVLDKLGVADKVPFVRLDPEGFDHVVIGTERVRVPNGLTKYRDRLMRRFPDAVEPLRRYFHEVVAVQRRARSPPASHDAVGRRALSSTAVCAYFAIDVGRSPSSTTTSGCPRCCARSWRVRRGTTFSRRAMFRSSCTWRSSLRTTRGPTTRAVTSSS